jgi:transcriptional regulator with XRE-family HTH domain
VAQLPFQLEAALTALSTANGLLPITGLAELDEGLGGLFWGDNVVWEVARPGDAEAPFRVVARHIDMYDHAVHVAFAKGSARYEGFEVVDATPATGLAQPGPLLTEIGARCRRFKRSLVLFDPLDAVAERWGAATAARFFTRCCPALLGLGAIAHWSFSSQALPVRLRREIEEITQCILVVGEDRLRIAKAEGRAPGVEGTVFHYRVEDGRPRLTPAPMATRVGIALRAAREQRQLSQSDFARLAGVSPSAISQAERGRRGLGLETLMRLSRELHMTLDELLGGQVTKGYRLARRADARPAAGARPAPLLDDPAVGLRAFLVRLPAEAATAPHFTHKGLELVAIAHGLVQVLLETGKPVLRAGEALLLESGAITGWRNLGQTEATLFWVVRD